MIESNFEYTQNLLKKINTNATAKSNLINEIAMVVIAVGELVAFIMDNIFVAITLMLIFFALGIASFFTAKSIEASNSKLQGQSVKVLFDKESMHVTGLDGKKEIYNAVFEYKAIKKTEIKKDLIYIYFSSTSVVIVPKSSFKTAEDCQKAIELVSNNYVV